MALGTAILILGVLYLMVISKGFRITALTLGGVVVLLLAWDWYWSGKPLEIRAGDTTARTALPTSAPPPQFQTPQLTNHCYTKPNGTTNIYEDKCYDNLEFVPVDHDPFAPRSDEDLIQEWLPKAAPGPQR
jgi:hypothetical protein